MHGRRLAVASLVCATLAIGVAAYAAYAAGRAQAPQVIRAQRFELADAEGNIHAVLAITPDLGATLKLYRLEPELSEQPTSPVMSTWVSAERGLQVRDGKGEVYASLDYFGLDVSRPGMGRVGLDVLTGRAPSISLWKSSPGVAPDAWLTLDNRSNPVLVLLGSTSGSAGAYALTPGPNDSLVWHKTELWPTGESTH